MLKNLWDYGRKVSDRIYNSIHNITCKNDTLDSWISKRNKLLNAIEKSLEQVKLMYSDIDCLKIEYSINKGYTIENNGYRMTLNFEDVKYVFIIVPEYIYYDNSSQDKYQATMHLSMNCLTSVRPIIMKQALSQYMQKESDIVWKNPHNPGYTYNLGVSQYDITNSIFTVVEFFKMNWRERLSALSIPVEPVEADPLAYARLETKEDGTKPKLKTVLQSYYAKTLL